MSVHTQIIWAIETKRLDAIFHAMKAKGMPDAKAQIESMALAGEGRDEQLFERHGDLAVVNLHGPLCKEGCWWWGYESMRMVGKAVRQAVDDPSVRAILLDIDSPGGTVDGTEELAGIVRTANAVKPVHAYVSGLMCSAAYWIGCQGSSIAAQATSEVGSIGVLQVHVDWSKALDQFGLKYSYLTAGKFKAMGNSTEPLNDESRAYIQDGLDEIYRLFLAAVSDGRKVTTEKAMSMADGRVFLGLQALEIGLVDAIEPREETINRIVQEVHMNLKSIKAGKTSEDIGGKPMAQEEDPENTPEAEGEGEDEDPENTPEAEGEGEDKKDARKARKAAASREQVRCLGIVYVMLGQETGDKVAKVIKSGISAQQLQAATEMLGYGSAAGGAGASGQTASQAMLGALAGVTQTPMNPAAGPVSGGQDFEALVKAETDKGATKAQAMAKVIAANPEAHATWLAGKQKKGGK